MIRQQDKDDITRPYGARDRKPTSSRVKIESKTSVRNGISRNASRITFSSVPGVSVPSSASGQTANVIPNKVEKTVNIEQIRVNSGNIQPTNAESNYTQFPKTDTPKSSPDRPPLHSLSTSFFSVQISYRNPDGLRDEVKQVERGVFRSILINAVFVFVLCTATILRRVLFYVSSTTYPLMQ